MFGKKTIGLVLLLLLIPISLRSYAATEEVRLDERVISDSRKSWAVTFNHPVNKGSVKKENVYIIDHTGKRISTSLKVSGDDNKLNISPNTPYSKDKTYFLHIKGNLRSGEKLYLNQHTIVPFALKGGAAAKSFAEKASGAPGAGKSLAAGTGSTSSSSSSHSAKAADSESDKEEKPQHILKAEVKRHAHFAEITVIVSDQVTSVKAGSAELDYKGSNQFLLYKPGVESGDKIKIKGYSMSKKVLETKEIIVP
ncbi:Ig-like domain-containing protein [Bacillus infantis]|uniref:Ig-like domain-containing protein n=1 Tax=Bacillus infantis TaxID=324767 RepID=UPI00209F7B48|nr:Ig-like domain-containing protein [Bacillus infantis]MCP1160733.1 Ig-like domain-containing protein [Bacillus infantis]